MTAPLDTPAPDELREAPSARDAPPVIHLPPPAEPAPIERPKRQRRGGGAGRHFGPRPVDDPRSAWLSTRTTPEFLAKVRADAKDAGLTLSDHMHIELGGKRSPRGRRVPTEFTQAVARLVAMMGKPGGLLNQGTHALNLIKLQAPEATSRDRLADLLEDMAEQHRQAIAEHRECLAVIMRTFGLRPDADNY